MNEFVDWSHYFFISNSLACVVQRETFSSGTHSVVDGVKNSLELFDFNN